MDGRLRELRIPTKVNTDSEKAQTPISFDAEHFGSGRRGYFIMAIGLVVRLVMPSLFLRIPWINRIGASYEQACRASSEYADNNILAYADR